MTNFLALVWLHFKLNLRHLDGLVFGVVFPLFVMCLTMVLLKDNLSIQEVFVSSASIGICASGIMGTATNMADLRGRKVLKKYRVSPVSPIKIVGIQFLCSFLMVLVSLACLYLCGKFFFQLSLNGHGGEFFLAYLWFALAIYSIGLVLASVAPNVRAANLLTTIVYFPMLFLSGATIPYEVMPQMMQKIVAVMPLTQGIIWLKSILLGVSESALPVIVLSLTLVLCSIVALKFFQWE